MILCSFDKRLCAMKIVGVQVRPCKDHVCASAPPDANSDLQRRNLHHAQRLLGDI